MRCVGESWFVFIRAKMKHKVSRKSFLKKTTAGLAAIIGSGCAPGFLSWGKKKNIVLITVDTLRADHLGCYGYPRNTSPNIDAFAEKTIKFNSYFTVAPITGPSTNSLFTGRYIQSHGVIYNWLKRNIMMRGLPQLIPDDYDKAGFTTNATLNRGRGYSRGFDVFMSTDNSNFRAENKHKVQPLLTSKGFTWLDKVRGKGRFFLWLHYRDPHGPYLPPEEFSDMFLSDEHYDPSKKVSLRGVDVEGLHDVIAPSKGNHVFEAAPRSISKGHGNMDETDYYIAKYDAEIRHTDDEVGKILDYLESKQLMDSTIVAISADHGESLGENNLYFQHGMLVNEGSIHIPLIISHPDVKEPLAINSLLQNTDLAPTLLGEMGLKFPYAIDGIDFSSLFLERKPDHKLRPFVYSCTSYEYGAFYETIRTETSKLIGKCEIERTGEVHSTVSTIRYGTETYSFFDVSDGKLDKEAGASDEMEKLIQLLRIFRKTAKGAAKASDPGFSEADREELKALGYLN